MADPKNPQTADRLAKGKQLGGRPTTYTPELGAEICSLIATSSQSLKEICEVNQAFPTPTQIYVWLVKHSEFAEIYARARADQAQLMAEEIVGIADNTQMGVITTEKPDGTEYKRADMIEHRKLRIDARKWVAAKLLPQKYGDHVQITHDASEGIMGAVAAHLSRQGKAYSTPKVAIEQNTQAVDITDHDEEGN